MFRFLSSAVVLIGLLAAAPAGAGAPASGARVDGPYVLHRDGAPQQVQLRRVGSGELRVHRSAIPRIGVRSEVDQAVPRFVQVKLRAEHPRAAVEWPMPSRLVVASDFEGNFQAFAELLGTHDVVDRKLHWSFGDGHLVLLGDLVDRGDNVLPLLWLVYRLEAEAEAAGGRVHYVLGNHEHMLLSGDTRYLHPKYHASMQALGETHDALWNSDSELGRWLRSKPVAVKIGDWLFTHGGVSPELLASRPSLQEIDAAAAATIGLSMDAMPDARQRDLVHGRNGLLWYRGMAVARPDAPKSDAAHVQAVLEHFGVSRVAIGHSLVQHVGSDYDGAVVRVDVPHAEGTVEGLLVEAGEAWRIDTLGQRHPLQAAVEAD